MLRRYLSYWELPLPVYEISTSSHLADVCRHIRLEHSNVMLAVPDEKLLEKAHKLICQSFFEKQYFSGITSDFLELVPWVLYWPNSMLSDSKAFLNCYVQWMDSQSPYRKERICITFWFMLLQHYPSDSEHFWYICQFVKQFLSQNSRARSKIIYKSCVQYALLSPEGASQFCDAIDAGTMQEALLARRIPPELFPGNFVKRGCILYLNKISSLISKPGNLISLNKCITNFKEYSDIFLAIGKVHVIESILLPFVRISPVEHEYKDIILDFLLENFGDPRLDDHNWFGVSAAALSVIERWLVAGQLIDFFKILRITAPEQWEERERFWSKYLEKQVISRAWVALGKMARKAVSGTSLPQSSFADLSGARSEQSVLLMQINDLVIIEWSHDGSCRFCNVEDKNAPVFYEKDYPGDKLRLPQHSVRHIGAWEYRVAEIIEEETGVAVTGISIPYAKSYGTWR